MAPRKIAAGNWKMNGTLASIAEAQTLAAAFPTASSKILICPPATLLVPMVQLLADLPVPSVSVGGQDCHANASGAHTGDISAGMLKDAGAGYVIVGHSERRTDHSETDADVKAKSEAAIEAGLTAILCIGETLQDREAGRTLAVLAEQLANSLPEQADEDVLVVAYEPVWAIGTGKVATLEQIEEVHGFVRDALISRYGRAAGGDMGILYGGSVKPDNAAAIFGTPNVDGALVGGASLKAADFSQIINALEAA